jgi:hypothetical protein
LHVLNWQRFRILKKVFLIHAHIFESQTQGQACSD